VVPWALMFEHAVYTRCHPEAVPPFFGRCQQGSPSRNCPKNHCLGSQNLGILDHLLKPPALLLTHSRHNSQAGAAAELDELSQMNEQQRRGMRYQKFRNLGVLLKFRTKSISSFIRWYNLLVFCNNFFQLSLKRLRFCQYLLNLITA